MSNSMEIEPSFESMQIEQAAQTRKEEAKKIETRREVGQGGRKIKGSLKTGKTDKKISQKISEAIVKHPQRVGQKSDKRLSRLTKKEQKLISDTIKKVTEVSSLKSKGTQTAKMELEPSEFFQKQIDAYVKAGKLKDAGRLSKLYELKAKGLKEDDLKKLLEEPMDDALVDTLVEIMAQSNDHKLQQAKELYDQLNANWVKFETEKPKLFDVLKMAIFCVKTNVVDSVGRTAIDASKKWGDVFKMRQSGQKRTIQVVYEEGGTRFYISSRREKSIFHGEGTYKTARSSLGFFLPLKAEKIKPPELFARVMTKLEQYIVKQCGKEFELAKFYGTQEMAQQGFVRLYSFANYTVTSKTGQEIPRGSLVYQVCPEDLDKLVGEGRLKNNLLGCFNLTSDILNSTEVMHQNKQLHADFKLGNVMSKSLRAKVTDFGATSEFQNNMPLDVGKDFALYYRAGFYGSITPTAPELFGVANFSGDHEKVEAFAVGVGLYELITLDQPEWCQIPCDLFDKFRAVEGMRNNSALIRRAQLGAYDVLQAIGPDQVEEGKKIFADAVEDIMATAQIWARKVMEEEQKMGQAHANVQEIKKQLKEARAGLAEAQKGEEIIKATEKVLAKLQTTNTLTSEQKKELKDVILPASKKIELSEQSLAKKELEYQKAVVASRKEMDKMIDETIEKSLVVQPLKEFEKRENKTPDDILKYVVYQLLRKDPKDRLTSGQALELLRKLCKEINIELPEYPQLNESLLHLVFRKIISPFSGILW